MRKLIPILLITALLFNVCGYYMTFNMIGKASKRQYHQHIYYSSLANTTDFIILNGEIKSANAPFSWMEDDDFVYYGKNHEIIKTQKQQISNIFYCLNNKKDEQLFTQFKDYLKLGKDANAPYQQKGKSFFVQILKDVIRDRQKTPLCNKDVGDGNYYYFFSIQTSAINNIFVPPEIS